MQPTFKWVTLFSFWMALATLSILESAPPKRHYYYEDSNDAASREMRDSLDDMRHEIGNHETEMKMFDEKLKNLETALDSIRQQLLDLKQTHKEILKSTSQDFEAKLGNLDLITKSLAADLKTIKSTIHEAFTPVKGRIGDLEKIAETQNQNIENLQTALRSLMEILQVKEGLKNSDSSSQTYKVKSGDSLEKIAKAHQITIDALKTVNNLSNDRIITGQKLLIPDKK
jgi:chromosome segregation ATPase